MKQVTQLMKDGKVALRETPVPVVRPQHIVIANAFSLISAGTEKMSLDLARKSLLGKARERPDQVRRVLEKFRQEGLWKTVQQVQAKLNDPTTPGYSSAGIVLACGPGVQELKPGDKVASNGPHAEVVCVPKHLCARVPEGVTLDHAAFTVLGAIALQGVRLAKVHLGETVLVVGLGLVGQLAVALLKAQGCTVLGTDPDASRCELALRMGAEAAHPALSLSTVEASTGGIGVDAVLIAAATASKAPMDLAAQMVRKRGRIVLLGVVGLELDRRPFYFKECQFVVSCSYGPGRYDPDYEERGHDYPAAYVRWTEQRNMDAVLRVMASGRLDVSPLISHRFVIEQAEVAYTLIEQPREPFLGVLLEYPPRVVVAPKRGEFSASHPGSGGVAGVGVIGAGNFAKMVLLPAIARDSRLRPEVICSASGLSAAHAGETHGFRSAVAEEDAVFSDTNVQAVFSITRHDLHASHVLKAQKTRKALFVEKPLCLSIEELSAIEDALLLNEAASLLMVGFNRRFSPAARAVKAFFEGQPAPIAVSVRFNAGAIPPGHWTQDDNAGGGRIVGEACHAIDLATYLVGSPPVRVFAESVGGPNGGPVTDDQCFITLRHSNGSISSVAYLAGGDKAFPKERAEVIGGGRVAVIEDFRKAIGCTGGKTRTLWTGSQDKGHTGEIAAFSQTLVSGGRWPIPWEDMRAVTLATILAVRSLREGEAFEL